ncbi:MAG: hypothetical protein ACRD0C_13320 [Acidimicrobiia bacterium]
MCSGGRFLAEFTAGTEQQPAVPEAVESCLTLTIEGMWVVWAHKLALPHGDKFTPLTGGDPYPADAVAQCRRGRRHAAPQRDCTCGFHAVSSSPLLPLCDVPARLDVALSGRVLAFEWEPGGVLFRAARQTVIRVGQQPPEPPLPPDPAGWLAARRWTDPRGAGPIRLRLPEETPPVVEVEDEAGYCNVAEMADPVRVPLPATVG